MLDDTDTYIYIDNVTHIQYMYSLNLQSLRIGNNNTNELYDQFDGKIADLQLYNSEYLNTSIDRNGIYSNLLYYKP
jgi:hypothetical protein